MAARWSGHFFVCVAMAARRSRLPMACVLPICARPTGADSGSQSKPLPMFDDRAPASGMRARHRRLRCDRRGVGFPT
jgi:hypothetical protein